jgi:hypothetical protein
VQFGDNGIALYVDTILRILEQSVEKPLDKSLLGKVEKSLQRIPSHSEYANLQARYEKLQLSEKTPDATLPVRSVAFACL